MIKIKETANACHSTGVGEEVDLRKKFMEKILLVLNAARPDMASINFACKIASMTHSRLTGVFVENMYFKYIPPGGIDNPAYFAAFDDTATVVHKADTEQSVRIFTEACTKKGIKVEVYIDKGEPLEEIIFESRFADLLIIDPAINFYNREETMPSDFLRELMVAAECPVLLTSTVMTVPDEVIFCYDGSASSVYAIKQFTYLMPQFASGRALLLEVKKSTELSDSDKRMMEWLRSHYADVDYLSLSGDVKDALFSFLFMKKKKVVVMGAYGRSILSNIFRRSNADLLIRTVDLPFFITHH